MRSGLAFRAIGLAFLLSATACGMKEVPEEDWGAITPDARIRVTLADGAQHDLRDVRVYTGALTGERIDPPEGRFRVPLDSIEVVETGSGAAAPILVGIAMAAATIWIIQARGKSDVAPAPTPVPTGSCPFIYSFDGASYRLDSETYAGAVVKTLERTDLDNLDHLQAVEGLYRIRLANERPETQYTDALTLQVVDHPEGTSVFSDATGSPRVMRDGRPPRTAVGVRGADVRQAVAQRDGELWTGDPVFTIDAADPTSFRDGVELTFPRPAADDALLAVHAQNTVLAPFVLERFLELFGDELAGWYRRVEDEPDLQSRIRSWIHREGTLHVSVWTDGGWELQDALLDVGPHLPKTQVARLDLTGTVGEDVRVRLEGPRGLWTIDQVSLGSAVEDEPTIHHLTPMQASDRSGRDVQGELSATDERYHTALTGDEIELTFQAPPPPARGLERTVMASTRGFYHIYVDPSGPPRLDVVERILDEPLFGNRYMLSLFRGAELDR